MATFSPKNFPADVGNNKNFSGAGERTTYAPTNKNTHKYKEGFPLEKDAPLYNQQGKTLKTLAKGTIVHFTYPAFLHSSKEFGITRNTTLAGVSLQAFNKSIDGYVPISSVTKPGGAAQNRIGAGSKTQDMVGKFIQEHCYKTGIPFADEFKTARPGSTLPDLVMTLSGKSVQFEIKGTNNRSAPITFFDKSVSRSKPTPALIEEIAEVYIKHLKVDGLSVQSEMRKLQLSMDFIGLIDFFKSRDPSVGLAGDEGVVRSGKLPPEFAITNPVILTAMHKVIIDHFAEGGDDYFVVHDRSSDKFETYFVGGGSAGNVLKMKNLPKFTEFILATYGGASSGSTRVGLKIRL